MGKSFQERVKSLEDFKPSIGFNHGLFILKIRFNKAWKVLKPDDPKKVAYSEDKNIPGLHWYASAIEDLDLVFDLIEQTIEVNKDMEKKIALYKKKVQELQELFLSDIPYSKLTTLEFTLPSKKKKKKVMKDVITAAEDGAVAKADSEIKLADADEDEKDANGTSIEPNYIDEQISKALNK